MHRFKIGFWGKLNQFLILVLSKPILSMKLAINNPAGSLTNRPSNITVLLCLFLTSLPATAQTIEVKLPTGITATANFHTGNPSQPAVLLVHGFNQTHHSQPMSSLAANLVASR